MPTPVVMCLYQPARNQVPYTLRAVELVKPQDELRILSCVHGIRNVPSIINLVEASRGLRKCKLQVFIMHLVEITERSSSIMMVSRARKDGWPIDNSLNLNRVLVAFEAYGQLRKVIVRPMMAISNFADMHEDICNTASEKRASLILLPFHKYQRQDGTMETVNLGFRTADKNVLHHAPCTVGGDDREALVLGCRMAEHPGVKLTVFHFLQSSSQVRVNIAVQGNAGHFSDQMFQSKPLSNRYEFVPISVDLNGEKQLDENCLNRVHDINADIEDPDGAIAFQECLVGDPYSAISSIGHHPNFDLLIVGRGRCGAPSLVLDLAGKQAPQDPELGPIGDALASSPLIKTSILVVQRHNSSVELEASPHSDAAT
ncbi:hypothetical protein SUGI_0443270 [Cryptomeria japonica]|nr:hypothetical protein SUGI_0443270 [Cryptomeria japonica]